MTTLFTVLGVVLMLLTIFWMVKNGIGSNWKKPTQPFPIKWRAIISNRIPYYLSLDTEGQKLFEKKVQEFLLNCKITAIDTEIDLTDRLLVASSAVIPIMGFKDWAYFNLKEVIIYPGSFDHEFAFHSPGK